MTTEEKAVAYDKIIAKANKMYNENINACKACIEELIPEIAESKEDEDIINSLVSFLENELGSSKTNEDRNLFKRQIEIVKSLLPQKQWKPTFAQMDALESASEYDKFSDCFRNNLKDLYEQLKVL